MPVKVTTTIEYSLTFNDEVSDLLLSLSDEEFTAEVPEKRGEQLRDLQSLIGIEGVTGVTVDQFKIEREEV